MVVAFAQGSMANVKVGTAYIHHSSEYDKTELWTEGNLTAHRGNDLCVYTCSPFSESQLHSPIRWTEEDQIIDTAKKKVKIGY